jgi:hypothetical protein
MDLMGNSSKKKKKAWFYVDVGPYGMNEISVDMEKAKEQFRPRFSG